ncbi:MAG TPA: hypothetical protein VNQ33_10525, partial [Acidimicrobiales bacterium]|nr:hypothetical protein [Acidimicrobiales bacterium]
LGASIGTALAGSVMIAVLTSTAIAGINATTAIPQEVQKQASVELADGIPFVSDTQLEEGLAGTDLSADAGDAIVDANRQARIDGLDTALAVLAMLAIVSLFFTRRLPDAQPTGGDAAAGTPPEPAQPSRTS